MHIYKIQNHNTIRKEVISNGKMKKSKVQNKIFAYEDSFSKKLTSKSTKWSCTTCKFRFDESLLFIFLNIYISKYI